VVRVLRWDAQRQFALLCETLPEDGMMRWFDPRSMESMDLDYDLDSDGNRVGEPFEIPDWDGDENVLVSRVDGTITHPAWEVGVDLQTMDAITGGSFVFHKPNLKGTYI
jgi:hypothetical protein